MSANRSSTETEIMTGQTITAEDEDQHITGFGSFPSDWKKASISECANIRDSERIPLNSTERTEKKPGEIPYYGANGVVDYIDDYLFDSELILLAEDGGHFDEYQSRPIAYRVSGKAWVNNHAHVLEAVEEVDTEYLFYSLEHRNLVPYVSGSTRSKLTKSMLQKVKVPLPPLAEQRKVASVLATVDAAIQKTEAIIEQADRVKRGLMQDILQHGLSGEALKEDPEGRFGKIPESWRVKRLSDVTDVVGGSTPDTNEPKYWGGTIRWATPSDITKLNHVTIADTARTITDEGLNSTSTHVLPPESVLLTSRASIGNCAVNTVPMATNQGFQSLVPGQDIDTWYLFYRISYMVPYLESLGSGSTFSEISRQTVRNLKIPVPPLDEQREIGRRLRTIDEMIHANQEQVQELRRLKRGLMQDLLTGRVRTRDKDIKILDEVAAHG